MILLGATGDELDLYRITCLTVSAERKMM